MQRTDHSRLRTTIPLAGEALRPAVHVTSMHNLFENHKNTLSLQDLGGLN